MNLELVQAEVFDALSACDELHAVLSGLKRLGLLTDEEDKETKENIERISDTLRHKLPESAL